MKSELKVWTAGVALAAGCALAAPAGALDIIPVYSSSITKLSDAAQIEASFNAVAAEFDSVISTPIDVYIGVSWGSVDGETLPSNAVGASVTELYGYFTYSEVKEILQSDASANPSDTALATAAANLLASTPSGVSRYVIPSAELKALGLISATQSSDDGYIGFTGTPAEFTIPTPAQIASGTYKVAAGTFDFAAVAAHEMEEVLGRISGIYQNSTPSYRTVFDLYRYDAKGALEDSYYPPAGKTAYFSIDGGVTDLATFNGSPSGGDRGDWASVAPTSADIQDAFISTGERMSLSAVDLTALDALGYGGSNIGDLDVNAPGSIAFSLISSAPEPGTWTLLLVGTGLAGAAARRRRGATQAVKHVQIA